MPSLPRRRSPRRSAVSPPSTSGASVHYFRRPNLGDKLQRLAVLSPLHLQVVELLVDQILKRLRSQRIGI